MGKFKVGDTVVRTKNKERFRHGLDPLKVVALDRDGDLLFNGEERDDEGWAVENFELVEQEVKQPEQPKIDRKLRLTEMQKEAIQAGINALYRHEESLKEQSYDPSLAYQIYICKYQQEVLSSMLREVNR